MPSFAMGAALASSLVVVGSGGRVSSSKASTQANLTQAPVFARWEKFGGSHVPDGRIPAAATECEGRFYIFGGEADVKDPDPMVVNRYMNDVWMFTPSGKNDASGTWTELSKDGNPDAPSQRVLSSMSCYLGDLFIFGGMERDGQEYKTLNDFWAYDIDTTLWQFQSSDTAAEGGPPPLDGHTSTLDKGEMVIFGGRKPDEGNQNKVWVYDPNELTWSQFNPPMSPVGRHFHMAVSIPRTGKMRVFGGIHDTSEDGVMWEFDVDTDEWTIVEGESAPEYEAGRAATWFHDKLWIFGGFKMEGTSSTYNGDLHFQRGGDWEKVTVWQGRFPIARTSAALFTMNGNIWVYGGYQRPGSQERLNDLWRLKLY